MLGPAIIQPSSSFISRAAEKARRPAAGEIEAVLKEVDWPIEPPFLRSDFARLDESDDGLFYDTPKVRR